MPPHDLIPPLPSSLRLKDGEGLKYREIKIGGFFKCQISKKLQKKSVV
jgi:hypothetical protein